MIHYDELPETVNETELETEIKQTLVDFYFPEHVIDPAPLDPEEVEEHAAVILEDILGHAVRKRSRLCQRVVKEITDRTNAARASYQYHVAKLKEEI